MTGMMQFLEGFFQEDNGNSSCMRMIAGIGSLLIIGTWAYMSIKTGTLISWGMKDVSVLMTLLGAKVWQKEKEENTVKK